MNYQVGWRASVEQRFRTLASDVSKLVAKVARLEGMLSQLGAGRGGAGGGARGRIARATSAIGASDETTPGGGTVQPMKLDGGDYADVGDPIAVKNVGDAISSGKRCSYWIDVDGVAWVEPGECEDTV